MGKPISIRFAETHRALARIGSATPSRVDRAGGMSEKGANVLFGPEEGGSLWSMRDSVFPDRPPVPLPVVVSVTQTVPSEPLARITGVLEISIHELVNDERCKRLVADFYRVTRRIENDSWLRRELAGYASVVVLK